MLFVVHHSTLESHRTMSFFGARPAVTVEPKDVEVPNLPTDSISAIAFSPTADILAVASWSNEVRLYEVNAQGQAVGKAAYSHEGPVLDVCWSKVRCALTLTRVPAEDAY